MNHLIEKQEFHHFVKSENKHLALFSNVLMEVLQLNKINAFYSDVLIESKTAEEFIENILKRLNIQVNITQKDLDNIPINGSFITISNHPFGGVDGLILLHILLKKRPDFKVIANFLLKKIEPISPYILPINPFEERKEGSVSGLKTALQTIQKNQPLGIFPAGEVSSINAYNSVTDKQWNLSAIKLIKKVQVPVVPIYFNGNNSHFFHLLGLINPKLRTAKLASEMFNKKNKSLQVKIGSPISVADMNSCDTISELSTYLRNRTYALKYVDINSKEKSNLLQNNAFLKPVQEPIDSKILLTEINALDKSNLLFESGIFQIYCAEATKIPQLLQQIGILRELTFREIGEGTGKTIDLDAYDKYYHHLFMWDKQDNKIVGAYRIGKGLEILNAYGKKGFYINSLFKIKKPLKPLLEKSLELGRSFVAKEYQKQAQPLFLLWKGILYFLIKNPTYQYLIGPVSISNDFTSISKKLMVEFIQQNYFDKKIASFVTPRKKYKVVIKDSDVKALVNFTKNDFSKLDKLIVDFEPDKVRIPILLKKYIKQNAKIVGFNVDPLFNNTLDGLVFLNLHDVPKQTIIQLAKDSNDNQIIELFYNRK